MNNFFNLNPDNFKKWMRDQKDFESNLDKKIIGLTAETKFSAKRISKVANVENGKPNKVIKEFIENGGTVKEIFEDEYLIEVNCGCFVINKNYIIV